MRSFSHGQRWISDMEPELGAGIITEVSPRFVRIHFPAAQTERQYAIASAPLHRLVFDVGDVIQLQNGEKLQVDNIEEENGLRFYLCQNRRICEKELDSVYALSSPKDRLFSGLADSNALFNLRVNALAWRAKHVQSPAFGFVGSRIDLIPHQLYVASQVASRQTPRVLLSDEVGLGKTIEACLIVHRLLLSRRIERVLILVPESLVHQWFVELLRRFNLVFRIIDADFLESRPEDAGNPFEDEQLFLINLEALVQNPVLSSQVLQSDWDMVVLDEAHHVLEDTVEYKLMAELSMRSKGLLLLTATPEQLGHRHHFARLKLLDPSRYYDFEEFQREEKYYQQTAEIVNTLLEQRPLRGSQQKLLQDIDPHITKDKIKTTEQRDRIVQQLIDRFGMGRVIFRNTRAVIPNFPKRHAHFYLLEAKDLKALYDEFVSDCESRADQIPDYTNDPRLLWLVAFLKKHKSKILLICHTIAKVKAIAAALEKHINIKLALFHEEMTLLQRDRNAAWFSEKEGARLLLCSEIGSEGRNFQFAHHLVLFDVPLDAELFEQRIRRLDRIGQKQTIHIHIPYVIDTPQETLVRWYHEGFNAFEQNAAAAFLIYEKFGGVIRDAAGEQNQEQAEQIIRETGDFNTKMLAELEQGRNRLLEINSFDQLEANSLVKEISALERDADFQRLMSQLFEHFGVTSEPVSEHLQLMGIDYLTNPDFPHPVFRGDRFPISFDRHTALAREDIEFLTPDHPMAMGALDLFLSAEKGTAAVVFWGSETFALLLECMFILECVAPARLHIERFFPPMLIRILVDHQGDDKSERISMTDINKNSLNAKNVAMLENPTIKQDIFPRMLDAGQEIAERRAKLQQQTQLKQATAYMNAEIDRLDYLSRINPNVSADEIQDLKTERDAIVSAIQSARLRLDAVRLVVRGEALDGSEDI